MQVLLYNHNMKQPGKSITDLQHQYIDDFVNAGLIIFFSFLNIILYNIACKSAFVVHRFTKHLNLEQKLQI